MIKTYLFTYAYLLATLLFLACKTPGASQSPTPTYRFEEEKLPSANPCAVCVAFSAATRYGRGSISWNLCSSGQPKGYLDLKLSRANRNFRIRLLRDCSNPAAIKVLRCPADNSDDFTLLVTSMTAGEGKSHVLVGENGAYGSILKVTISSASQVRIELTSGWTLHYGKQLCGVGGN